MELNIGTNLIQVRARLADAALRSGRKPDDITLVGVSKVMPAEVVQMAYRAGLRHFGENRAQELRDKYDQLPPDTHWHFIGGLQANKIKYVVGRAELIHSVDSLPLIQAIDRRAAAVGTTANILIQVNIAGEDQKGGVAPADVDALLKAAEHCEHLAVKGLMMIPPNVGDPEASRPYFKEMYTLFDRCRRTYPLDGRIDLRCLSMGMSGDFEVAIEEGANIVRVGSAIFGPRG